MCREIQGEENFRLLRSDVREPFLLVACKKLCLWTLYKDKRLIFFVIIMAICSEYINTDLGF